MSKILEIENCYYCPFYFSENGSCREAGYKKIIKLTEFPSWCPLPDKPEPITEEQHYRRGYQKGYHEGYQKALDENGILSGEDAERFIQKMKEVNDGKNT